MSQGFTSQLPIPLPVAQGGTGVTTSTGTGSTVLSTSPTLTTPRTAQINDTNGNASLTLTATASAVNYMQLDNAVTGANPKFYAAGSDTNISINLNAKGTGAINLLSENAICPVRFYNGTGNQHQTQFFFSNTSANRDVTFPDVTGTVTMGSATVGIQAWINFNGSGTPAARASSNVTSITDNNVGDYTINFTSSLADANYAMVGSSQNTSAGGAASSVATSTTTTPTASACRVVCAIGTSGNYDATYIGLAFLR